MLTEAQRQDRSRERVIYGISVKATPTLYLGLLGARIKQLSECSCKNDLQPVKITLQL